jgi:CHAD domain-containing protein
MIADCELSEAPSCSAYLASERAREAELLAALRQKVQGNEFGELCGQACAFLRLALPGLIAESEPVPFVQFAARRIKKRFNTVLKERSQTRKMAVAEMHAIRNGCKRIRYWAEFAAPVLGRSIDRLALRTRRVTASFGNVHDRDVQIERLSNVQIEGRPVLLDCMSRAREEACRQAAEAWGDLRKKRFVRHVKAVLGAARQAAAS